MRSLLMSVAALTLAAGPAGASNEQTRGSIEALVNRITWGRTQDSVAAAERLGVERWLDLQLRPPAQTKLPTAIQAQIDGLRITRTPMPQLAVEMDAQGKAALALQDPAARMAAQQMSTKALQDLRREATARALLRDIYSPDQLREQMIWFWFNHFNVQADKRDIRTMVGDYEESAIRPYALGKFRDLLKAADLHPAMLRYLDNDQNAAGRINENFAREVLELHTMGVGSGYKQKDVEELARVLTGVGVSLSPDGPKLKPEQQAFYVRRGLMEFNPARHDFGAKTVLGRKVKSSGLNEFEETLDLLAREPATAKHVCTKLALYFMKDAPPKLIDRMSIKFLNSDGDIAEVLRVLFKSAEFKASLGQKMKDPVHYVVSAVRITYGDKIILNTDPIKYWLERMGQPLYAHETPDGYPLEDSAWSGPGQLTTLFEIARQVGSNPAPLFRPSDAGSSDANSQPPAPAPRVQILTLSTKTQDQLSNSTKVALAQARSPAEWNTLFLSSPEFLHR